MIFDNFPYQKIFYQKCQSPTWEILQWQSTEVRLIYCPRSEPIPRQTGLVWLEIYCHRFEPPVYSQPSPGTPLYGTVLQKLTKCTELCSLNWVYNAIFTELHWAAPIGDKDTGGYQHRLWRVEVSPEENKDTTTQEDVGEEQVLVEEVQNEIELVVLCRNPISYLIWK